MRSYSCVGVFLAGLIACGSPETQESVPTTEPAPPSTAPPSTAPRLEPAQGNEPTETTATQEDTAAASNDTAVNLLEVTESAVAVSSVYRGHDTQVVRMLDGDPETAWNSRSGDLVGAWIEVRVPESARVTGAKIIVGFTHENDGRDLFTANQRIQSMRVSRNGESLGEFNLDTDQRTLQSMPFEGPGGVFRFEVTEALEGSTASWREICVSEFQLMGIVQIPESGRLPRIGVGALPAALGDADRDATLRAHRQALFAFSRDWLVLEDEIQMYDGSSGDPHPGPTAAGELSRSRTRLLDRLVPIAEAANGEARDQLRRRAASSIDFGSAVARREGRQEDLARADVAMRAVGDWLDDAEARCRVARAFGAIYLRRLLHKTANQSMFDEMDEAMADAPPGPDLYDVIQSLEDHGRDWSSNTRGVATRLSRMAMPPISQVEADWTALQSALTYARAHCGWE